MNMPQRIFWLDEIRGFSASIVVLFHYFTNFESKYGHSFDVPHIIEFGYLGVQIFFIVSGFVIFMTIQNIQDVKMFLINRFLRLLFAINHIVF